MNSRICKVAKLAVLGAAVGFAGPSLAADVVEPYVAPVAAPVVYDWTGVYIGIHGGYGWAETDGVFDSGGVPGGPYNIGDFDTNGGILGAHAGFNWQWNNIVFGIEGDVSGGWLDDTLQGASPGANTVNITSEVDLLASVRGRLGFAADNVLFYGTLGAGYADYEFTSVFDPLVGVGSVSDDDWGLAFGGGVEYAWGNWLFRLEGIHYDVEPGFTFAGGEVPDADAGDTVFVDGVTTVRLGVSYKF